MEDQLSWMVTILLFPVTLGALVCLAIFCAGIATYARARAMGMDHAQNRTRTARGTVDGGGPAILPYGFCVVHATWEDPTGNRYVAIGPVTTMVTRSGDDSTRFDGDVLELSNKEWDAHVEQKRKARLGYDGLESDIPTSSPELQEARGKLPRPMPEGVTDDEPRWEGSPMRHILPPGTEVDVVYDPARPNDARILHGDAGDGSFISGRHLVSLSMTALFFLWVVVATITISLALHGWEPGWGLCIGACVAAFLSIGMRTAIGETGT